MSSAKERLWKRQLKDKSSGAVTENDLTDRDLDSDEEEEMRQMSIKKRKKKELAPKPKRSRKVQEKDEMEEDDDDDEGDVDFMEELISTGLIAEDVETEVDEDGVNITKDSKSPAKPRSKTPKQSKPKKAKAPTEEKKPKPPSKPKKPNERRFEISADDAQLLGLADSPVMSDVSKEVKKPLGLDDFQDMCKKVVSELIKYEREQGAFESPEEEIEVERQLLESMQLSDPMMLVILHQHEEDIRYLNFECDKVAAATNSRTMKPDHVVSVCHVLWQGKEEKTTREIVEFLRKVDTQDLSQTDFRGISGINPINMFHTQKSMSILVSRSLSYFTGLLEKMNAKLLSDQHFMKELHNFASTTPYGDMQKLQLFFPHFLRFFIREYLVNGPGSLSVHIANNKATASSRLYSLADKGVVVPVDKSKTPSALDAVKELPTMDAKKTEAILTIGKSYANGRTFKLEDIPEKVRFIFRPTMNENDEVVYTVDTFQLSRLEALVKKNTPRDLAKEYTVGSPERVAFDVYTLFNLLTIESISGSGMTIFPKVNPKSNAKRKAVDKEAEFNKYFEHIASKSLKEIETFFKKVWNERYTGNNQQLLIRLSREMTSLTTLLLKAKYLTKDKEFKFESVWLDESRVDEFTLFNLTEFCLGVVKFVKDVTSLKAFSTSTLALS